MTIRYYNDTIFEIEQKSNDEDGVGSTLYRESGKGGSLANVSKVPITSELKFPKR